MNDILYKGCIESLHIAFQYAVTTDLVNEAVVRHNCDPIAAHLLARALTGGLLAAATGDAADRINIRWTYTGSVRNVVVDAGADGTVRGLVGPAQFGDVSDTDTLFGEKGDIQVVRSRLGKITASGTVEACFMDVVDDLMGFLCMSDQVESSASVWVAFSADPEKPISLSRGLLLQALPGCDLEQFQEVRTKLSDPKARALLGRISEPDNLIEDVLHVLLDPIAPSAKWRMDEGPALAFKCSCSREKMSAVLRALPYAERIEIAQKKEDIAVRCHFCNERYILTPDDCIAAWNAT